VDKNWDGEENKVMSIIAKSKESEQSTTNTDSSNNPDLK
jgi:hypothetical protein